MFNSNNPLITTIWNNAFSKGTQHSAGRYHGLAWYLGVFHRFTDNGVSLGISGWNGWPHNVLVLLLCCNSTCESSFLFLFILGYLYMGRLSDKIGRKPLLILSLIGSSAGSRNWKLCFLGAIAQGLAKNIWALIIFRAITGLFAGSWIVAQAYLLLVVSIVATSQIVPPSTSGQSTWHA